jgi:hypothetical protein
MAKYSIGGHEVPQDAGGEAINELDKNKTLFIESLTAEAPNEPEIVTGLTTLSEVFEHFQPEMEVEFTDEEGTPISNTLTFRSLDDFGKNGVIAKSEFLQKTETQRAEYTRFMKMLQIKQLGNVLNNPEAKAAYVEAIRAMIQELEDAGA